MQLSSADLDRIVTEAAASYKRLPPALAEANPVAVAIALELAGGNVRRLVVEDDGAVFVANREEW